MTRALRLLAGPALFACAALSSCTFWVQGELDRQTAADAGCPDYPFSDGSPDSGFFLHTGVLGVSFAGGSAPPATGAVADLLDGTLIVRLADQAVLVFGHPGSDSIPAPLSDAWPVGLHQGYQGGSCVEVLAAEYDSLRLKTTWSLYNLFCGDPQLDAGTTNGLPSLQAPAVGFAANPDGGAGQVAILFGAAGAACTEDAAIPCFPPDGGTPSFGGGPRQLLGLVAADGTAAWLVAEQAPSPGVRLHGPAFQPVGAPLLAVAARLAPLASDAALALYLEGTTLRGQVVDVAGRKLGSAAAFETGTAGAQALEVTPVGGGRVRAVWRNAAGAVFTARADFSNSAAPTLGPVGAVCGPAGAAFAAPLSDTRIAVLGPSGDLHLRPAP